MSPTAADPATRKFWALGTGYNGGAVIQKLPDGSPPQFAFFEAQPLAPVFPNPASMRFSKGFPKELKVLDSVASDLSVPIVSARLKAVLDQVAPGECEFLPVVLLDHKGKVASPDHAILNPLRTADLIDMKLSKYRTTSFEPDQIATVYELHVLPAQVDPAVHIFRAATMQEQIFIDEVVHDAFERAQLTGLRLFPAEGWDGNTM
jgi:hypothetical protein